jgi:hypothetical protein
MVRSVTRNAELEKFDDDTDFRFVDRDEFCRLMLGFASLVRVDDAAADLRGLRDTATGVVYLIERKKLHCRRPRAAT